MESRESENTRKYIAFVCKQCKTAFGFYSEFIEHKILFHQQELKSSYLNRSKSYFESNALPKFSEPINPPNKTGKKEILMNLELEVNLDKEKRRAEETPKVAKLTQCLTDVGLEPPPKAKKRRSRTVKLDCTACHTVFDCVSDLNNHKVFEHNYLKRKGGRVVPPKSKHCKICNLRCGTQRDLNSHLFYKHPDFRPWKCDQCPFETAMNSRLRSHALCHNAGDKYACSFCTVSFKQNWRLETHLREDHNQIIVNWKPSRICESSGKRKSASKKNLILESRQPVTSKAKKQKIVNSDATYLGSTHASIGENQNSATTLEVSQSVGSFFIPSCVKTAASTNSPTFSCTICSFSTPYELNILTHEQRIHNNSAAYVSTTCDLGNNAKIPVPECFANYYEQSVPNSTSNPEPCPKLMTLKPCTKLMSTELFNDSMPPESCAELITAELCTELMASEKSKIDKETRLDEISAILVSNDFELPKRDEFGEETTGSLNQEFAYCDEDEPEILFVSEINPSSAFKKQNYDCQLCLFTCACPASLRRHMKNTHTQLQDLSETATFPLF